MIYRMLRISKNIKRIIQWDVKCELPSVCQALSLSSVPRNSFSDDLTLSDFMGSTPVRQTKNEKITKSTAHGNRTVFVETYGEFAPFCLLWPILLWPIFQCLQR